MRRKKERAGSLWIPGSFDMRQRRARALVFGYPPSGGVAAPAATVPGFFVSPTGLATNAGTFASPWSLAYALSGAGGAITPGSTVWLRGGQYGSSGTTWTSSLTGSVASPIRVRQYPGELATISDWMTLNGSDTWYQGFEVRNLNAASQDTMGIFCNAARSKLINLIVHDHSGNGIGHWLPAVDSEVHGCISYYNGFTGSDPGNSFGHGIYMQNTPPSTKSVSDCLVWDNYGFGFHGYGESAAVSNLTLQRNLMMANRGYDFLIRSSTLATNDTITLCMGYSPPWPNASGGVFLGEASFALPTQTQVSFTGNYIVGSKVEVGRYTTVQFTGNTVRYTGQVAIYSDAALPNGWNWDNNDYLLDGRFCGGIGGCPFETWSASGPTVQTTLAQWQAATGFDAHSTFAQTVSGKPATNVVFVYPNLYESGRANIVVYNWQGLSSVSVDLSAVLNVGDLYSVFNVQTILGAPVLSGTYTGAPVIIPITTVAPPTPLGATVRPTITFPSTGTEFQAFVVRLQGA